jgi:hypothetical protein
VVGSREALIRGVVPRDVAFGADAALAVAGLLVAMLVRRAVPA